MAFFRCGGGGGEKTVVLPDNTVAINVFSKENSAEIFWDIPQNSEVDIENFKIYICKSDTKPASLKEFTLYKLVEPTVNTCVIDNLENDTNYYIAVCSVTTDDYENASLRSVAEVIPRETEIIISNGDSFFHYSNDGIEWNKQTIGISQRNIKWVHDRWISTKSVCTVTSAFSSYDSSTSTTYYKYTITGTLYYSFDKEIWVTVNFTLGTIISSSYSSSIKLLDNVEYIDGMYATVSSDGYMFLTKDFQDFTKKSFENYNINTESYGDYFHNIGNYIVNLSIKVASLYTYANIKVFNKNLEAIKETYFSNYASAGYDQLVLFAKYTFGLYFCAAGCLYHVNGINGTITLIAKLDRDERPYSMFSDENYVYYVQYRKWKWYRALLGSVDFVEMGVGNQYVSGNNVVTVDGKWIAISRQSGVMYSNKDISNWVDVESGISGNIASNGGF